MTSSKRKSNVLNLFIVEDHDEVVPFIYRCIGKKVLPMKDLVLVHLDSHPDLLIPLDMSADDVFDKEKLFECTSIENWILPMVYAGHVSDVVWVKSPWCHQIADQRITFYVGKCRTTDCIRTTCRESYFVSEALFCPEDEMENKKLLTLTVMTLKPTNWESTPTITQGIVRGQQCEGKGNNSVCGMCHGSDGETESKKRKFDVEGNGERNINTCTHTQHLGDSLSGNGSISCTCKQQLGGCQSVNETLKCVKHSSNKVISQTDCSCSDSSLVTKQVDTVSACVLEKTNSAADNGILDSQFLSQVDKMVEGFKDRHIVLDIDLDFYSTKNPFKEMLTERQYSLLEKLFAYHKPDEGTDASLKTFVQYREKHLKSLKDAFHEYEEQGTTSHSMGADIKSLFDDLRTTSDTPVDVDLLHDAGCTMDDTELPHHVSSQEQITLLVDATQEFLSRMMKPTVITMARSSEDDYCPPDQVDDIQRNVLEALQNLYLDITVNYAY